MTERTAGLSRERSQSSVETGTGYGPSGSARVGLAGFRLRAAGVSSATRTAGRAGRRGLFGVFSSLGIGARIMHEP